MILAHASDAGAASLAVRMRREVGAEAVQLVAPEALPLARWSHRVDASGQASTHVDLHDSGPLTHEEVGVVLNRIRYLPLVRFTHAHAKDRDYAAAEFEALVLSWLAEFGARAVHDVRRHACVWSFLPNLRWASAAASEGLPVFRRQIGRLAAVCDRQEFDTGTAPSSEVATAVLVADDQSEGALAERFGRACVATARALSLPLLEFRFRFNKGEPALIEVDPFPLLDRAVAVELTCRMLASRLH